MKTSTSGFVTPEDFSVNSSFTEVTEMYSGAYCILYKAKRYGQWYVLKTLKEEHRSTMLYRELLKKEFDISISLSHPNIVRTIGWENVPGVGECIIMEYIDGVRVIKGVISALSYVHGKQIVHRDLKPANIMVTANGGNAKILDFGLSDTDSYSILKHPAGTDKYISPEQLTESVPDCRNDIYSLGKVIKKADISLFYNHLANKCMRTRTLRFANVESISSYINAWEKFVSAVPVFVLFVVSVVFISLYSVGRKDSSDKNDYLNEAIENGKKEVDKIYEPLIEFIGGREKISYEEYKTMSNIMSEIGDKVVIMCDSLTDGMDEVSKSTVTNAVSLYSSDLFKDISLPMPVMEEHGNCMDYFEFPVDGNRTRGMFYQSCTGTNPGLCRYPASELLY